MTHSPPIPAGNQSPYPLQEPPHAHDDTTPAARADDRAGDDHDDDGETFTGRLAELPLGAIGAAVGIGAAVIGAVLLGLRGASAKAKPRRGGRKGRR